LQSDRLDEKPTESLKIGENNSKEKSESTKEHPKDIGLEM